MKCVKGQARHHAGPQGLYVVAVGLAFQSRAFAKPTAWGHARESHGLAVDVVGAHFEKARDIAKPISHRAPDSTHKVTFFSVTYPKGIDSAFEFLG